MKLWHDFSSEKVGLPTLNAPLVIYYIFLFHFTRNMS